jgi:serine/arginine repetitive matrix protein 2
MWNKITGKSDGSKDPKEEKRTRSKRGSESVVSSSSARKPTRSASGSISKRDTYPASPSIVSPASSYATAYTTGNDDLYDDPYEDPSEIRMNTRMERVSKSDAGGLRDDRLPSRREERREERGSRSEAGGLRDREEKRASKSEAGGTRDPGDKKKEKAKERKSSGSVMFPFAPAASTKESTSKTHSSSSTPATSASRKERSSSASQPTYRGDIVESPRGERSVYGDVPTSGHMMSGALPSPGGPHPPMSSHVADQFPGQNPSQFTAPFMPGLSHSDSFGAAAEYYGDAGQSVHQQPGVRPQPPSVIMPIDTPHLVSASSTANPVEDTGTGAAADFYGPSNFTAATSAMPGAFVDEGPPPAKPPRPSSKPSSSGKPTKPVKPSKFGSGTAATLAGGAALGYAMGHNSSSNTHQTTHQSTSFTNGTQGAYASSGYYGGGTASIAATDGSQLPTYSSTMEFEGKPPPMPPRPGKPEKQPSGSNTGFYGKPEKQPSGSSNAGLYAAGAAGLAAYGLHHHNSHNHTSNTHTHVQHNHLHSMPGSFSGQHNGGMGSSSSQFTSGGMAQHHEHKGPVTSFVSWWKDHEDVQKMEEYTEFIGVCRGCFDPRSSVMDAPRKHHYNRKRSSEFNRPPGIAKKRSNEFPRPTGIEKDSRYGLSKQSSRYSLSGDEKKHNSSNKTGWLAAGLGGVGLASAGKALWNSQRDDFDDTYSIKSGRHTHSRVERRSRSRSRERKYGSSGRTDISSGRSEIRHRSRSRDRASRMTVGVTNDLKDHKFVRRQSRSRSRSHSRDRKSGAGGLIGAALAGGLAASAVGASRRKHRSRSRSRSYSPEKQFVHHQRDSSEYDRRQSASNRLPSRKSSKSTISSGSVIDISHKPQAQSSGIFGGFFAPPPPKIKRRTSQSRKKKKKGFFSLGNASSSSSEGLVFGEAYVRKKSPRRRSRRNSDEKFNATLLALGATTAAIAASEARKNKRDGKRPEVVAVRENRHGRRSSDRRRLGAPSRYAGNEVDHDGWEDLPDDDTSDSGESVSSGLAFGDYDWKKGKSSESLASSGSGTSKWFWRWGSRDKKKKKSSENLHLAGNSSSSLIGPGAAALAGGLIGAGLSRHDSSASSNLQPVYPVQTNDPTGFDARPLSTSTSAEPHPFVTSRPDGRNDMYQPQPQHHIPGAFYVEPNGPPVFSQPSYPQSQIEQQQQQQIPYSAQPPPYSGLSQYAIPPAPRRDGAPPLPRRSNSSPIQSSWKRDAAVAGALGLGAVALANSKKDKPVRFNFTEEQAKKEGLERRKDSDSRDTDDRKRRREEDARKQDEDRRREQARLDDERLKEEERRRRELQRQNEEAVKYEADRLRILEEQREAERLQKRAERRARDAKDAEQEQRRLREARAEALRAEDLEREAEQMRLERRETERREMERREAEQALHERREAERHEAEILEDTLHRRRKEEAREYSERYESDRDRDLRKLEEQRTGSSIASDVVRKEKELRRREKDVVEPDTWKQTVAAAAVAGTAAVIASKAIDAYGDKDKKKSRKESPARKRSDSSSSRRTDSPSSKSRTRTESPATTSRAGTSAYPVVSPAYKKEDPSYTTATPPYSIVAPVEPAVKVFAPSQIEQDYADEEIFDPNIFKRKSATSTSTHAPRAPSPQRQRQSSTDDVFQEFTDRYNEQPISQADFFAPAELRDHSHPSPKIDPNEGAKDIQIYQAHDDLDIGPPRAPPYNAPYAFTATKDGGGPSVPWPVPSLNLIQPTPPSSRPASRTSSVRGSSVPPSPAIEPVREVAKVKEQDEVNRRGSRVSWGENHTKYYDITTPDEGRGEFMTDSDLKKHGKDKKTDKKKEQKDEIIIEVDSPESGKKVTTYRPETREIPASTQYVPEQDETSWDAMPAKKVSKKDKKKGKSAAVAAIAAAATAAVVADKWGEEKDKKEKSSSSRESSLSRSEKKEKSSSSMPWDEPQSTRSKTDNYSPSSKSEPFADSHSTISSWDNDKSSTVSPWDSISNTPSAREEYRSNRDASRSEDAYSDVSTVIPSTRDRAPSSREDRRNDREDKPPGSWSDIQANRPIASEAGTYNPFLDEHRTPSSVSTAIPSARDQYSTPSAISSFAAPSTVPPPPPISEYRTPSYGPISDPALPRPKGFVEGEITKEPEEMHIPGAFDDEPPTPVESAPSKSTASVDPPYPVDDEWAATPKKGKKGKGKKEKADSVDTYTTPEPQPPSPKMDIRERPSSIELPRNPKFEQSKFVSEPELQPEPVAVKEVIPEPEKPLSKKDKKKKAKAAKKADSWEETESSQPSSPLIEKKDDVYTAFNPVVERDPRDIEPASSYSAYTPPAPAASSNKKGDFVESDYKAIEPTAAYVAYTPVSTSTTPSTFKKPKPAKRQSSGDKWEDAEPGVSNKPDIRDVETEYDAYTPASTSKAAENTYQGNVGRVGLNGSSVAKGAFGAGFMGLAAAAMRQDQDRIASEAEAARVRLEEAKYEPEYTSPYTPTSPPLSAYASASNGTREDPEKKKAIPSTAFHDVDELVEAKTPKRKEKRNSGRFSPSVGSPLRNEMQYEDYVGPRPMPQPSFFEEPQPFPEFTSPEADGPRQYEPEPSKPFHNVQDSGYYAPDDLEKGLERKEDAKDSSEEFYSAGSEERKQASKSPSNKSPKSPKTERYDDPISPSASRYNDQDTKSISSFSPSKYEDDVRADQDPSGSRDRGYSRDSSSPKTKSPERGYAFDSPESPKKERGYALDNVDVEPEKKRHHKRRETDERSDDWDTRSMVSETRSEANGERRRKSKSEGRHRSSSVVSSPPTSKYEDEKSSSKKEKEKARSGLLGLFSRSKESLVEKDNKSSNGREEDDEERKHRRKKHRDRGSTYGGSDDDDMRSTVSSSGRKHRSREDDEGSDTRSMVSSSGRRKHRSRSERGDDDGNVSDTRSTVSTSSRKHRSRSERLEDEGSDTRSTISSSGRRKHRSRSERAEDEGNVSDTRSTISSSGRKHRSRGSEDAGRDTLDAKVDHTVPLLFTPHSRAVG